MTPNYGLTGRFTPKKRLNWPEWLASGLVMAGFAFFASYVFAGAMR
jgi:hypothetical protein